MTSGQAVKYKSSLDAFNQIVAKEGTKSLFKGAGANVLRAVAGAGVLSGYDQLQLIFFGKAYSGGGGWLASEYEKIILLQWTPGNKSHCATAHV